MIFEACNPTRQEIIRSNPGLGLNGLDYMEVINWSDPEGRTRSTLALHFLLTAPRVYPPGSSNPFTPDNFLILGGDSIQNVTAADIFYYDASPSFLNAAEINYLNSLVVAEQQKIILVRTNEIGDDSTYTLKVVDSATGYNPDLFDMTQVPAGIDVQLASIDFSFVIMDNSAFDVIPQPPLPPATTITTPNINYLTKDYESFRTLILDRITQLTGWDQGNAADLGVVISEVMAYVGDYLSYQQDAVGTEAYLDTARSRISLRRHARLMDYTISEGSNARAWVQLRLAPNSSLLIVAPEWSGSSFNYVANQVVDYQSNLYQCILSNQSQASMPPSTATSLWKNLGQTGPSVPVWVSGTSYSVNQAVGYTDPVSTTTSIFVCNTATSGITPPSSDPNWTNGGIASGDGGDSPVAFNRLMQSIPSSEKPMPVRFYTQVPGIPGLIAPNSANDILALSNGPQVFEPLYDATLYATHNDIQFYTWAEQGGVWLPQGATEATLLGTYPNLKVGDVLVIEEAVSPQSGSAADANPLNRCAVRLTGVLLSQDILTIPPTPITEIQWATEDALPFALPLAATIEGPEGGQESLTNISIVHGNMVLADNGYTLPGGENLPMVPQPSLYYAPTAPIDLCDPTEASPIWPRYRPILSNSPLTQAAPAPVATSGPGTLQLTPGVSASSVMTWSLQDVLPAIYLLETSAPFGTPPEWTVQRDLLQSGELEKQFVVEIDTNGSAELRFGDDVNGRRPDSFTQFDAVYRTGNGTAGNVGAQAIFHVVTPDTPQIVNAVNWLAAQGGVAPETNAQITRRVPQAFLTQERAVTPADYAAVAEQNTGVLQASANLRWTGSWYSVFLTADPVGGGSISPSLLAQLSQAEEMNRLAGEDVQLNQPVYVSLAITVTVAVDPNYFQADVRAQLLQVLGSQPLPNGQFGLFYQNNFTFGQTVYLSPIYAAIWSVPGVVSAQVTQFQRQGIDTNQYLNAGELPLGELEIARLNNDPNFPEHGILTLNLTGGL